MDAELACLDGVTDSTSSKQARYWQYWLTFLESIELDHDPFLTRFAKHEQHRIIAGFGASVRANQVQTYSGASSASAPVSDTVRATFDAVAQTFRANDRPSPIHDDVGNLAFLLQRQLRGYKNGDASPTPQKALTPRVLRELLHVRNSPLDVACGQLGGGAYFYAMRSCEYTKTTGTRRTKLLQLQNLRFFRDNQELSHDHPDLHLADSLAITWVFQKNDERDATVTQHRTRDAELCPVRLWSAIVRRILSYPSTGPFTSVNTVLVDGKLLEVTSKMLLDRLRAIVKFVGEDRLGFKAMELGTHSIRSGAAMGMYLAGVPVFTIMLIGRWSSDAFLRYIRRQVQEFSSGVSARMIVNQDFFTIPDFAGHEDPRTSGHVNNFAARNNIGSNAQRQATLPAFSLHH